MSHLKAAGFNPAKANRFVDASSGWRQSLLSLARIAFEKIAIDRSYQRHIESIQPDHRPFALMFVIVVTPGRSENKIPRLHPAALAVNGCIGSLSLHNDAQGRRGMVMGNRDFSRQDQLHRSGQRRRGSASPLFP